MVKSDPHLVIEAWFLHKAFSVHPHYSKLIATCRWLDGSNRVLLIIQYTSV